MRQEKQFKSIKRYYREQNHENKPDNIINTNESLPENPDIKTPKETENFIKVLNE